MRLFEVNPGYQCIYDSLADFMLLATVVALARQLAAPPKLAAPILPATIPKHPGKEMASMQEKPIVSREHLVSIPQHLRRQRDRYIRRWTQAMFESE